MKETLNVTLPELNGCAMGYSPSDKCSSLTLGGIILSFKSTSKYICMFRPKKNSISACA